MAALRHTHKYEKRLVGGNKLWCCALGGKCTHYLPKHLENLIVGRESVCWSCGRDFTLDNVLITEDRPICHSCRGSVDPGDIDRFAEYLKNKAASE